MLSTQACGWPMAAGIWPCTPVPDRLTFLFQAVTMGLSVVKAAKVSSKGA